MPARGPSDGELHADANLHDVQRVAVRRGGARLRDRLLPLRLARVRRGRLHRTLSLIHNVSYIHQHRVRDPD